MREICLLKKKKKLVIGKRVKVWKYNLCRCSLQLPNVAAASRRSCSRIQTLYTEMHSVSEFPPFFFCFFVIFVHIHRFVAASGVCVYDNTPRALDPRADEHQSSLFKYPIHLCMYRTTNSMQTSSKDINTCIGNTYKLVNFSRSLTISFFLLICILNKNYVLKYDLLIV